MKKIVLTYGLIAGIIITGLMYLTMPFGKEKMDFEMGETLGYITMIISLSLIFFAIKSYRDKNNGEITFGKAFMMGLYITLIAGLLYAIGWEIYYQTSGGDFLNQYTEYLKTNMEKEGRSQQEIERQMQSMESMKEYYKNPFFRFAWTLFEITPVGIIISLIAAGILKRKSSVKPQ